MPLPDLLKGRLRLPVIAAPMFLVSGPELATAACKAGVIGALPVHNARSPELFGEWIAQVHADLAQAPQAAPLAANVPTPQFGGKRWQADMDILRQYQVPVVITAIGDPTEVVQEVHRWGGIVLHDATTLAHAEKAARAGVDGINVICGGAGGHAGLLNPFAFLPQVRRFFDGLLCLAGGMSDGPSILAAQTLGADLVYMGTRFIATQESLASAAYKQMLVDARSNDVLYTPAIAGMPGNFLKPAMKAVGLDPDNLPPPKGPHQADLPEGVKAWRDIWSAGQGVGLIEDVPTVAELVARLEAQYQQAQRDQQARMQAA
jgi:nitronate monooxygenase